MAGFGAGRAEGCRRGCGRVGGCFRSRVPIQLRSLPPCPTCRDLEGKRALLAAIARLSLKGGQGRQLLGQVQVRG